ncbi:MAG: hypothetical protein ACM3NI_12640 [Bacteroidota bacterium]
MDILEAPGGRGGAGFAGLILSDSVRAIRPAGGAAKRRSGHALAGRVFCYD